MRTLAGLHLFLILQTIYNAITNGTPCVIVEGSGRVADVIAQVAALPVSEITISLIQQQLSIFFQEMFETFTENQIVEWTKKVRHKEAYGHQADSQTHQDSRDQKWIRVGAQLHLQMMGNSGSQKRREVSWLGTGRLKHMTNSMPKEN